MESKILLAIVLNFVISSGEVASQESATSAQLVNFTLYMESLCPDCVDFFRDQLSPAFDAVGSIMNLFVVPYGKATQQQHGDRWHFECQHGKKECYWNVIETCAIHFHPSSTVYFPFIKCIESSTALLPYIAPLCAMFQGLDYYQIQSCAGSRLGNSLEHQMGLKTEALNPPLDVVPWVTLNGVHTDEIQAQALTNLTKLIYDTYLGTRKPPAC